MLRLAYEFCKGGCLVELTLSLLEHEYNTRDSNQMMRGAVLGNTCFVNLEHIDDLSALFLPRSRWPLFDLSPRPPMSA